MSTYRRVGRDGSADRRIGGSASSRCGAGGDGSAGRRGGRGDESAGRRVGVSAGWRVGGSASGEETDLHLVKGSDTKAEEGIVRSKIVL